MKFADQSSHILPQVALRVREAGRSKSRAKPTKVSFTYIGHGQVIVTAINTFRYPGGGEALVASGGVYS